jgi:hypothetical protein
MKTAVAFLIVGLCCGIATAVRVNSVLFVGPLLCWILVKDRRSFFWCAIPVLILGTLVAAYNYAMFGNLAGSYPSDLGWCVTLQTIGAFRQSDWDFEPNDIDSLESACGIGQIIGANC